MKIYKIILFLFFSITTTFSQNSLSDKNKFKLDEDITYGELENGFTYYLKPLKGFGDKINVELLIKAGSRVEDADQLAIAHAIEHVAFRASKNFPLGLPNQQQLLKEAETEGIGKGFYAFSGFYTTHYSFFANPKNPKSFQLGLTWYKDIINGLKLKPEDINKERGALKQEFQVRTGNKIASKRAEYKMISNIFPCRKPWDNYLEHLDNFDPAVLRRYYQEWYRPDLSTLIVVGNIENIAAIEQQIKNTFSQLPKVTEPKKVKNCDSLYFNFPNQFTVIEKIPYTPQDTLMNQVQLNLFYRDPGVTDNSTDLHKAKRSMLWELVIKSLRNRYEELLEDYNNNFSIGGFNLRKYRELPAAYNLQIKALPGEEEEAVMKTIKSLRQVERFGPTVSEWKKLKNEFLKHYTNGYVKNSRYWIDEIQKNAIHDEKLPRDKNEILNTWLSELSLMEFHGMIKQFFRSQPEDIGLIVPEGKAGKYSESIVQSWLERAYTQPIPRYHPPQPPSRLLSEKEVERLEQKKYTYNGKAPSGSDKYTLNNGLKVILHNSPDTSITKEPIHVGVFSNKGSSCFPKESVSSAMNAPSVIKNAGVGHLNKFELDRYVDSNMTSNFKLSPYTDNYETGLKGMADQKDLRELLQLMYLYFTKPRKDKAAFENWKTNETKYFIRTSSNLQYIDFKNNIEEFLSNDSPAFQMGTASFLNIKNTKFEEIYSIYHSLFSDADDFTLVVTGKFDKENVLNEINKYLGNLPNSQKTTCDLTQESQKAEIPDGPLVKKFTNSLYNKRENIMYSIGYMSKPKNKNDWQEKLKVEALGNVLQDVAWSLRFKKGFTLYQVIADGRYHPTSNNYDIYIKLDCLPSELKQIQSESKKIFSKIKNGLVKKEIYTNILDRLYAKYEKDSKDMSSVHSKLVNKYQYKFTWVESEDVLAYIKSLKPKDIIEVAKLNFTENNQYQFFMSNN